MEFDILGMLGSGSGGGLGSMKPNIGSIVGAGADMVSSFMPEKSEYSGDKGHITLSMDSVYDGIADSMAYIPGWGTFASAGMKVGKVMGQGVNALGGGTDGMTTQDAILGSSFFNLTPVGMINGFGGSKTDTMKKDDEAFALTGNSYGGSELLVDIAGTKAGKKYGLFSLNEKNKANRLIRQAGIDLATISDIGRANLTTNQILANLSSIATAGTAFSMSGGYDAGAVRAAKYGAILARTKLAQPVEYVADFSCLTNPESFKEGGLMNIIPDGALHKNKHHIEDANPDLKGDVTEKGIPVITDDNGEVIQHAEIERDELVLAYDISKQIEDMYKQYYDKDDEVDKEELAIKAGKLLAESIMTNTDDRTGLLETVE